MCRATPQVTHVNPSSVSPCVGSIHGATCDFFCEDGYFASGTSKCMDGFWSKTGSCNIVGSKMQARPAVQQLFSVEVFRMDATGTLVPAVEINANWAEERARLVVIALEEILGVAFNDIRLEVLPLAMKGCSRLLQAASSVTPAACSASDGGGFELVVTLLSESAHFSGMLGGGTNVTQGRRLDTDFWSTFAAKLAESGEATPFTSVTVALGPPSFIAEYSTPIPDWIEGRWSHCSIWCTRQRKVSCSVFGDAACTAHGARPPIESECSDGTCAAAAAAAAPIVTIVVGLSVSCGCCCALAGLWWRCCTFRATGREKLAGEKGLKAKYRIDRIDGKTNGLGEKQTSRPASSGRQPGAHRGVLFGDRCRFLFS